MCIYGVSSLNVHLKRRIFKCTLQKLPSVNAHLQKHLHKCALWKHLRICSFTKVLPYMSIYESTSVNAHFWKQIRKCTFMEVLP